MPVGDMGNWGQIFARTLGVGEADGERHGLGLALADVRGGVPHPAAVRPDVGRELHLGDDCTPLVLLPSLSPLLTTPPTPSTHNPGDTYCSGSRKP